MGMYLVLYKKIGNKFVGDDRDRDWPQYGRSTDPQFNFMLSEVIEDPPYWGYGCVPDFYSRPKDEDLPKIREWIAALGDDDRREHYQSIVDILISEPETYLSFG